MPIYEYSCKKCKKRHELLQRMSDAQLTICPSCGGELKKLMSNTSFVLKGSGWYLTDYADKKKEDSKPKPSTSTSGDSGCDSSASTEPKAEPTAETKSETKTEKAETTTSDSTTKTDASAKP